MFGMRWTKLFISVPLGACHKDRKISLFAAKNGLITAMNWVLTCERYKSFCKDRKLWKTT